MIALFAFLNLSLSLAQAAPAKALPPISVLRFDDEASDVYDGCERWPSDYVQRQLRTQLESALVKAGFPVQERRQLRELYGNEFELDLYNGKNKARNAKFKAAKFAITGGLTEMGYCADRDTTQVAFGGLMSMAGLPGDPRLDTRIHHKTAKLKLVLQLVDVETAESIQTFDATAEAKEKGGGVTVSIFGSGIEHAGGTSDLLAASSAEAIAKVVTQLTDYFAKHPST